MASDTSNNITFPDLERYVLRPPTAAEVRDFLAGIVIGPVSGTTGPVPATPGPVPSTTGQVPATPADRQPTEWKPRTGRIHRDAQAVSAGGKLGKPAWSDDLRRHNEGAGDKYVGVAEESLLPGWDVVEREHERWVPAP